MAKPRYLGVNLGGATLYSVAVTANNLLAGKINSVAEVTLDTGTASTTVSDFYAAGDSYIQFMPLSAAAASELASGVMYVSNTDKQEFTIEHSSGSSTRSFRYVILG